MSDEHGSQRPETTGLEPLSMTYEIVSELGAGSYGRVYRARQLSTGQLVAIKRMRVEPGDSANDTERFRRRFRREMELCAELSHPHIVRLIDSGETPDGAAYVVFEYVPGQTLEQLLHQQGSLAEPETLRLMIQVLDALACAHGRGVVHRDLKPANIMVSQTGARRNAMVLDFGLAGFSGSDIANSKITMSREMLGTISYSSPEQLRGKQTTARSDLYSWGLVFLECLTGEPAFSGASAADVLHQQLSNEPVAIPDWVRRGSFGGILSSVTAKDPDLRADQAAALLDQLEAFAGSAPAAGRPTLTVETGPPEPRGETGERVSVTVLSCNIRANLSPAASRTSSRSGANAEHLEHASRLLRARIDEVASRSGGQVSGVLGGRTAYAFGFPVAQEDAANRAVRSALEMIDVADTFAQEWAEKGIQIAVHLGAHSGFAVATAAGDEGLPNLTGGVLDLATELEGLAGPGEVIVSSAVRDHTRGRLEADPVDAGSLRAGLGEFSALRVRSTQEWLVSHRPVLRDAPFVGRAAELATLTSAYAQSGAGRPHALFVSGEPGMGKSRLLRELRDRVSSSAAWIECRCSPETQNTPYAPIVAWLRERIGDSPLREFLADLELDLEIAQPLISALVSPANESVGDGASGTDLSAKRRKELTQSALVALVFALGVRQRAVFVVEDLHWADSSTLELLTSLVEDISAAHDLGEESGCNLMVVLSARPDAQLPAPIAALPSVRLVRLARADVESIVRETVATRDFAESLIDRIVQRADGVPLFVEEIAHSVAEYAEDPTGEEIPETLHDLLAARLGVLAPAHRRTAQLAAAIGREFDFELLRLVAAKPETELESELSTLARAGLVHRRRSLAREAYVFKHSLVRDAAHDSMLAGTRRRVHGEIAAALRQEFPEVEAQQPERLARHLEEAGENEDAIRCWGRAGRQAMSRFANVEAAATFRRALDLIPTLRSSTQRNELELDLHLSWGRATTDTQGFAAPGLDEAFARSHELCEEIEDLPRLFYSLNGLWSFQVVRGGARLAPHYAERQARLARITGDPTHEFVSIHALGVTAFFQSRFEDSASLLERGCQLYEVRGDDTSDRSTIRRAVEFANIRHYLAWCRVLQGRPDAAIAVHEKGIEEAKLAGEDYLLAEGLNYALAVLYILDEPQRVLDRANQVIAVCEERGFDYWRVIAESSRGWARVRLGEVDEGLAQIQLGNGAYRMSGAITPWAFRQTHLIDALRSAGRIDEALEVVDDLVANYIDIDILDRFYNPEVHRLRGALLAERGDFERAEAAFRTALAAAHDSRAHWLELRAAIGLGQLLGRMDRSNEVQELVAQSLKQVDAGSAYGVVRSAEELLNVESKR